MLAFYIAFTAYPPCSQGAVPPGPLRPKGYSPKGGGSPLLLTHPAPSQRSRQRAEHAQPWKQPTPCLSFARSWSEGRVLLLAP